MRFIIASLLTTIFLTGPVMGQGLKSKLFELNGPIAQKKDKTKVTSAIVLTQQAGVVTLQVKLVLPKGANTYSQDPDLPKPTRISVELPNGWTAVDPGFTPNPPPKKSFDEIFGQEMEKFYGSVVFSRRYSVPNGTDLKSAKLSGKIAFLVCDNDSCTPQTENFIASLSRNPLQGIDHVGQQKIQKSLEGALSKVTAKTPATTASRVQVAPLAAGYEMNPKRSRRGEEVPDPVRLQFELTPLTAKTGEVVTLAMTMTLAENWSTYGLTKADEDQTEMPTVINFSPENLEAVGNLVAVPEPEIHTTKLGETVLHSNAHEGQVTWVQRFRVLQDAPYGVTGKIRYQICETGKTCMPPHAVSFSLGDQQRAEDIADARPIVQSYADLGPADQPPPSDTAALATFNVENVGGDLSLVGAFIAAFFAGLIMNILPCVLPVLAIKILSLVQQAGESRGRIIALNLAYTAGVMSVFMVFAVLSWGLGQSLSSIFQNETFMIVMTCVVFLMGLSLFGVFELPVPGIIPSAGHHQEGYLGAFNTGIIATVLGTPCIGPFIAPVFTWSLTQPTAIVFSMFAMMGVGMASPFLLTGLFPKLVNWLPRPGDWMVRFKQFTGFILMGTVIWLLITIDMVWRVPVLVLLLALAMLVWMSANLAAPSDSAAKKGRAYLAALVTSVPIFVFGLWMMREFQPSDATEMHVSKMPWREFSGEELIKLRSEGRPMLIDFTANWCVICKINEKVALDRDETVRFVEENGFVPMLADFTKENPEILKWLREFGQDSVPLTIIVPPGQGSQIIALRGQYSKGTLLEKLQLAVQSTENAGHNSAPALSAM